VRVINRRGDPMMPTNLPDPQERKEESREKLLRVLFFASIALVIAFALIAWWRLGG
jgi:hypothetical protein